MDEQLGQRYAVVAEEGPPRGDLYALEQTTYYHVVDTESGQVLLTFSGVLEAGLSRDSGLWDDYTVSGVREVMIAPDQVTVIIRYYDGREEWVSLP